MLLWFTYIAAVLLFFALKVLGVILIDYLNSDNKVNSTPKNCQVSSNPASTEGSYSNCLVLKGLSCPSGFNCQKCRYGKYEKIVHRSPPWWLPLSLIPLLPNSNKTATTLLVKNKDTGQVVEFSTDSLSRSRYKFRKVCVGLERLANELGLSVYFLTLTLRDSEVGTLNSDLNKFLSYMRSRFSRSGEPFYYTWIVELQKRRYTTHGVMALHWHFAIITKKGCLPNIQYKPEKRYHYYVKSEGSVVTSKELYQGWGKGQILCGLSWCGVRRYLEKYMSKDYEQLQGYKPEWAKLRRFGSSKLHYRRLPQWAYDKVKKLADTGIPMAQFAIRKVGTVVAVGKLKRDNLWDTEQVKALKCYSNDKKVKGGKLRCLTAQRFVPLFQFKSPWSLVYDTS
jgi:hypothetical protein